MISIASLRQLVAAGMTAEQIVDVVEAELLADAGALEERRSRDRERKARQRSRDRLAVPVTSRKSRDMLDNHIETLEEFKASVTDDDKHLLSPHTPLSSNKDSFFEDSLEERKKERVRARVASGVPTVSRDMGWVEADWNRFWGLYPHKIGKPAARAAFARASRKVEPAVMFTALQQYADKTDDRPFCNPATWLNQERWLDVPAKSNGRRTVQQAADDLIDKLREIEGPAGPEIRDGAGETVVRLLSEGRRGGP